MKELPEVILRPIDRGNWEPILRLKIRDEEKGLVATNAVSVAEAYIEPRTFPLGIFAVQEDSLIPVGFLYYGQFAEDRGEWWIARLMVDENHRGHRYGEAAMLLLTDELRHRCDCERVYLSIVPRNSVARQLYERVGFVSTKESEGGEEKFVLEF